MKPFLTLSIVGVIALIAASLAAIADQSDKFVSAPDVVGLREVPSYFSNPAAPAQQNLRHS